MTTSKKNVVIFFHHNYGCLSCAIIRIYLLLLYSNLHKETGIRFSQKRFLHKFLFKIPLWREIDDATSYFLISSKNFCKIVGGKGEEGRVNFLWRIKVFFSKLMFQCLLTQFLAEVVAME